MSLNTEDEVRAVGGLGPSVAVAPFLAAAAAVVAGRLAGAYPAADLKLVEAYLALHLQYVSRTAAAANGAGAGGGFRTSQSVGGASESYATPAGLGKGLEVSPWGVLLRTLDWKNLLAPAAAVSAEWLGDDRDGASAISRYPRGVY